MLVCPDCGCESFTQTRYVCAEFTVQVPNTCGDYIDIAESIEDRGELDVPITCSDCGASYDDAAELSTPEQYDAGDNDDA